MSLRFTPLQIPFKINHGYKLRSERTLNETMIN